MKVERNRASWTSVAAVERRSGGYLRRGCRALAALFLSLRRHDPDQVRRVAAHPAASQPPVGAPLGCGNYPQSAALSSRLQAPGRILVKRLSLSRSGILTVADPGLLFRNTRAEFSPPAPGEHTKEVLTRLSYSMPKSTRSALSDGRRLQPTIASRIAE